MTFAWQDIFEYDESSPSCLRWKITIRSGKCQNQINVKLGDVAGTLHNGYYRVGYAGNYYMVHHVVWEMHYSTCAELIDHKDGNPSNNKISNLRNTDQKRNMRNLKKYVSNTSGVTGVYLSKMKTQDYWTACWRDGLTGKLKSKNFSISKLGNDKAFKMACEYRAKMIEELNKQGAGYTERHGRDEDDL